METQTNSLSLVEFYKSVLEAANVSSDENGLLSLKFGVVNCLSHSVTSG